MMNSSARLSPKSEKDSEQHPGHEVRAELHAREQHDGTDADGQQDGRCTAPGCPGHQPHREKQEEALDGDQTGHTEQPVRPVEDNLRQPLVVEVPGTVGGEGVVVGVGKGALFPGRAAEPDVEADVVVPYPSDKHRC